MLGSWQCLCAPSQEQAGILCCNATESTYVTLVIELVSFCWCLYISALMDTVKSTQETYRRDCVLTGLCGHGCSHETGWVNSGGWSNRQCWSGTCRGWPKCSLNSAHFLAINHLESVWSAQLHPHSWHSGVSKTGHRHMVSLLSTYKNIKLLVLIATMFTLW